MKKLIFATLVLFVSVNSYAKQDFQSFVNETIVNATEGFSSDPLVQLEDPRAYAWYHNTTRIRFRPVVGLEIPWLAKLEIKPTVDLIWKRK